MWEQEGFFTFIAFVLVSRGGNPRDRMCGRPRGTMGGNPRGTMGGSPRGTMCGNPRGTIGGNPRGSMGGNLRGAMGGNLRGAMGGNHRNFRDNVVEPRFHDGLGPPAGGLGPSQSVQHPEADPVTPP